VRAPEATQTRATAQVVQVGAAQQHCAVASAYRMSITHGSCDTLLWSQLVERDTPVLLAPPTGAQWVSHFQGTLVVSPIGVRMCGVDRKRSSF
jgi:hypothetical protein